MSDKEKLHQILLLLWKNDNSVGKTYYNQALQDIQTTIDLQEEPVSEELEEACEKFRWNIEESCYQNDNGTYTYSSDNIEEAFKAGVKWQKEKLWKFADGDDLEEAAEEWDESLYRSDAFKAGAKWQKQKDSMLVNEDLEKASYLFACKCHPLKTECSISSPNQEVIEAFKTGAKWQKVKDQETIETAREEMIEKVCEYIASNMRCDGYTLQTKSKFIKDLKQAINHE